MIIIIDLVGDEEMVVIDDNKPQEKRTLEHEVPETQPQLQIVPIDVKPTR